MSVTEETPLPAKLKLNRNFQPCTAEPDDEFYPNGIFLFNISRLLAYINAHPERFTVEHIEVAELAHYGEEPSDKEAIRTANLSRPIVLAEISPGLYNLIDGYHRAARARRDGVRILPGWRIRCPEHVGFLTSTKAYEKYVEYWNGKVKDLRRLR